MLSDNVKKSIVEELDHISKYCTKNYWNTPDSVGISEKTFINAKFILDKIIIAEDSGSPMVVPCLNGVISFEWEYNNFVFRISIDEAVVELHVYKDKLADDNLVDNAIFTMIGLRSTETIDLGIYYE